MDTGTPRARGMARLSCRGARRTTRSDPCDSVQHSMVISPQSGVRGQPRIFSPYRRQSAGLPKPYSIQYLSTSPATWSLAEAAVLSLFHRLQKRQRTSKTREQLTSKDKIEDASPAASSGGTEAPSLWCVGKDAEQSPALQLQQRQRRCRRRCCCLPNPPLL